MQESEFSNFQPENIEEMNELVKENTEKFGIGHLEEVQFNSEQIPSKERKEVLETYAECIDKIKSLLADIHALLENIQADSEQKQKIFTDFLHGIKLASYRTANQVLYHSKTNTEEALNAFDEFVMLLETVHQSFADPQIIEKKAYANSAIYRLVPPCKSVQHREPIEVDTLFSEEHIAWNISSRSQYNAEEPTKSGIRLDYNPLYKQESGGLNKTKTAWVTSIDISGRHIDKIMNEYSSRGHHFTNIFKYKVNLLIPGLSKAMEHYFDLKETDRDPSKNS